MNHCCDNFASANQGYWIQHYDKDTPHEYDLERTIKKGYHIINDEMGEPYDGEKPLRFCPWCGRLILHGRS